MQIAPPTALSEEVLSMGNPRSTRYGRVAQLLHWLIAILVLVAFIYGPGGSEARVYQPSRDFERQLHETHGMAVFALTLLRMVWRTIANRPLEVPMQSSMRLAAKAAHVALYLLLLAVPLSAVIGAWLQGHPVTLLGGMEFASLVETSHDLGTTVAEIHTWLGDAILWVAGLHAAAAIYHHAVIKDAVLLSMLPRWFPLRQR
jgi:cytochrome b561